MNDLSTGTVLPTGAIVGEPIQHESAHLHVSGRAVYADDVALPAHALHAAFGISRVAHGRIKSLDLAAVLASPGVVALALAADVPGENNYGSIVHDDPIFAEGLVQYAGQPLFAVAATSLWRRAPRRGEGESRVRGAARDSRHPQRARRAQLRDPEPAARARRSARTIAESARTDCRARARSVGRIISTSKARSPSRAAGRRRDARV